MTLADSFKSALRNFSKIGFHDELPFIEKLRIQTTNECALIVSLFLSLNWIESIYHNEYGTSFFWVVIILPQVAVYLNSIHKYIYCRIIFTVILPILTLLYWVAYGNEAGLGYTFFPYLLATTIFYDYQKIMVVNLLLVLGLLSFGMYYTTHYESVLSHDADFFDIFVNSGMSVLTITWALIRFVLGIKNQEELLSVKNAELNNNNTRLTSLNHQNQLKTELLGMVAHDLRGPALAYRDLTQKLNYLLKKDDYQSIDEIGSYFEASGEKLFSNLDNLLHWVISQQDKLIINEDVVNLKGLVKEVIRELNYALQKKEIGIDCKIDHSVNVITDKYILKIILRNIIENAIKYSPKNSIIILEGEEHSTDFQFYISDTGLGIDNSIIQSIQENGIFKKGIQQESHGLGLQICCYFAKKLNIKLDFNGIKNKGTKVSIRIPKKQSSALQVA